MNVLMSGSNGKLEGRQGVLCILRTYQEVIDGL